MSYATGKRKVTQEEFDVALESLVDDMSAAELFGVPGFYEVIAEYLNNDAIDCALATREATLNDSNAGEVA